MNVPFRHRCAWEGSRAGRGLGGPARSETEGQTGRCTAVSSRASGNCCGVCVCRLNLKQLEHAEERSADPRGPRMVEVALGGKSHIESAWHLWQSQGYRCDEWSLPSPAHLTSAIFYWDLEKKAPHGSVFSNCVSISWQLRGELALHHFLFLM